MVINCTDSKEDSVPGFRYSISHAVYEQKSNTGIMSDLADIPH